MASASRWWCPMPPSARGSIWRAMGAMRERGVGVVSRCRGVAGGARPDGRQFGAGAPFAIVYSMHATKVFATAEGGADPFGRCGVDRGAAPDDQFRLCRRALGRGAGVQRQVARSAGAGGCRQARSDRGDRRAPRRSSTRPIAIGLGQFAGREGASSSRSSRGRAGAAIPVAAAAACLCRAPRGRSLRALAEQGIGAGSYFSPHLAEQPWFRRNGADRAGAGVRRCRRARSCRCRSPTA
jgi:hypothetical protein